ncbi:ATPase [soil metagenome]
MTGREPVALSWSGGKDSAMALLALREAGTHDVVGLLTTVTEGYERIAMHGVRAELLERQATAIGLRVRQVRLPQSPSNDVYEAVMGEALRELRDQGVSHVAFGDLFLADIRAYREAQMAVAGIQPLFPVWHRDTSRFVRELLDLGFRAVLVCVDTTLLDSSFAGRMLDEALLDELPDGVDPCGENGEFHTFVFDGPYFSTPIGFVLGERVTRDGICYQDLVPESQHLECSGG